MYVPPSSPEDVPTVAELVAVADKTVAGLEKAKRRIALLLRRQMLAGLSEDPGRIPNLLVLGPSGGGKTHLLTTMLSASGAVYTEANITEYSDVGYVGRDMVEMYGGLVAERWRGKGAEAHRLQDMVAMAERFGVVLIDEFDKIRMDGTTGPGRKKTGATSERQVGRALQAELLKLVEGTDVMAKRFSADKGFSFNTRRVLHIATGAFEGLPRLMNEIDNEHYGEDHKPTPSELEGLHMDVEPYDIQRYGFMQELIGRFASIVPLPSLDVDSLSRILREHIIPNYDRQMAIEGITFHVEPGALSVISGEARKTNIGARALEPLIEQMTAETWPDAHPGSTIVITADSASRRTSELRQQGVLV